ncbi:XRE family transcriptional regulator [Pseudoalteromonas rubra]|uniref:XRE family transcriptional regulator n=1 Tax=Pseudoalteromonas rubra TaxID=43658 RepID=A0A4Q7EQC5_9GAMM|nr:helix-turn-helix transcriptional regulator [Pseudoalteromonas rubra]RZM84181.1 XRE family transcriptional regulator [Pseudoalteromonas rubra]
MKTEKQQLGSNLKELRLKAELSQEELADISSLHRTYIGSVERGERNISLENIIILSRALKVLPAELLKGIE